MATAKLMADYKHLRSFVRKLSIRRARAQLIQWWARQATKRPVRFTDEYGHKYSLHPSDCIATHIERGRCTDDPALLHILRKNIVSGMICFDIGANIGAITMAMSTATDNVWVHAFEPELKNFSRLCANVALNKLEGVVLHNLAVSKQQGIVPLTVYEGPRRYGHHTLAHHTTGMQETSFKRVLVKSVTLDEYCQLMHIDRIDILKIDVEGAEPDVLAGAANLLEREGVALIVFEVSKVPLESMGHSIADLIDRLNKYGYSIGKINTSGHITWGELPDKTTYFANYIAALNPDEVRPNRSNMRQ